MSHRASVWNCNCAITLNFFHPMCWFDRSIQRGKIQSKVSFLFLVLGSTRPKNIFASTQRQARLAQSVERTALNRVVVGSSPTVGVLLFLPLPHFAHFLCQVLVFCKDCSIAYAFCTARRSQHNAQKRALVLLRIGSYR